MLNDAQLRPPRVISRWKTRKDDNRPKKVRDYFWGQTLEQIHGTTYHKCDNQACRDHQVIGPHQTYIKVSGPGRRRIGHLFIPEVHLYHPECLPELLHEAGKLFE